jgi:hypothetical protein
MQDVLICVLRYGLPSLEVAAAISSSLATNQSAIFTNFSLVVWGWKGFPVSGPDGVRLPNSFLRFEKVIHVKTFGMWQQLARAYAYRSSEQGLDMHLLYNYTCGYCLARDLMIISMVHDNYDLAVHLAELFGIEKIDNSFLLAIFLNGSQSCYNYFFSTPLNRDGRDIYLPQSTTTPFVKVDHLLSRYAPLNSTEMLNLAGVWEWLMAQSTAKIAYAILRLLENAVKAESEIAIRWLYEKFRPVYMDNYSGPEMMDLVNPLFMRGFEIRCQSQNPMAMEIVQRCRVLFCRQRY